MAVHFGATTRELLDGPNFPILATVNVDGSPQSSVIWAMRDGDSLLLVVRRDRPKGRNIARDPRVSLSVFDSTSPYRSAEIRGMARITIEPATLQRELAVKYLGTEDYPEDGVPRVVVRVAPEKVIGFGI